jgi:hypothetical protein
VLMKEFLNINWRELVNLYGFTCLVEYNLIQSVVGNDP